MVKNEPLSKHTTFKIGGPAKRWVEPRDIEELRSVLNKGLAYRIIGNGSNILVRDEGVPWAVIKLTNFKELSADNNTIKTGSGVSLNELIRFSIEKGLSGLEFLAGIPGTVGGAIKTNTGAFGKEIADVLEEIDVMDRNGNIHRIPRDEIVFGYRYSNITDDTIILGGKFYLLPGAKLEKRRDRLPVEFPNAGSIFKNPDGVSAGELIDRLGLKGTTCGKAMVSNKHANIIVNLGSAKAEDVMGLINYVKNRVLDETGINLELEIECW